MANATQVTQTQYGIADELKPFAENLLGQAQAFTNYNMMPYREYTDPRVAQFSPLQQQSYDYAGQLQSSPQLNDATALTGQAGLGGLNTQYTYQPSNFGSAFSAANTRDAQGNVTGNTMMNPYMENVVARQQQDATRQAAIAGQAQQAQAARSGAFGGSGDYLMRGQAAGNLARQKGDIQAQGLNNAYTQAQNQYNTQYGQNAAQQQFGAGLGMQGLSLANQSAQNLGALGQTQYAQNMGITGLQNQLGLQQQQQAQNLLNTQYENFTNAQNYPYKQMAFMSDIIRGTPLFQTGSSMYQPPGNTIGQIAGLGAGIYGLSSLFGDKKAEGGSVHSYAGGGQVNSASNIEGIINKLSDEQLKRAYQVALAERDVEKVNLIRQEEAQRSSMRQGISSAITPQFAENMEQSMATGGIVAFAGNDGSVVNEGENYSLDGMRTPNSRPTAKATQSKPSPVVQSAVAQLAAKTGQDPVDLNDATKQFTDMFESRFKPQMDLLRANVEASKPDNDAIRQQGLGQALAQFGFKMAANAAKPGARFLESAASASPELSDAAAKTQDLMAARQKNYQDMQMRQAQFEIQFNNGNMKDATMLAGQLRQQQQADKMYQFSIAKAQDELAIEKQKLAQTGAYYSAMAGRQPDTVTGLAKQILQDPSFKGTPNDALDKAANMLKGGIPAAIRADATTKAALANALGKIEEKYPAMIRKGSSKFAIENQTAYENAINNAYSTFGEEPPRAGGATPGGASTIMRFDNKGNPI
jgi:hypothetical protein